MHVLTQVSISSTGVTIIISRQEAISYFGQPLAVKYICYCRFKYLYEYFLHHSHAHIRIRRTEVVFCLLQPRLTLQIRNDHEVGCFCSLHNVRSNTFPPIVFISVTITLHNTGYRQLRMSPHEGHGVHWVFFPGFFFFFFFEVHPCQQVKLCQNATMTKHRCNRSSWKMNDLNIFIQNADDDDL